MKFFEKLGRGPGVLIPLLCIAIGLAAAVAPSCATVKPVIDSINNPDSAVGAIVADCVKPEIANEAANLLAAINTIAVDPSTTTQVKNDQIDALKKMGQAALACALRAGVTDLTALISNAAQKHAAVDPRVVTARQLFAENVMSHGYTYTDGWSSAGVVTAHSLGGSSGHATGGASGGATGGATGGADAGAGG